LFFHPLRCQYIELLMVSQGLSGPVITSQMLTSQSHFRFGHFRRIEAVGDESGSPLTAAEFARRSELALRAKLRRFEPVPASSASPPIAAVPLRRSIPSAIE
jgi:hypothetical protein